MASPAPASPRKLVAKTPRPYDVRVRRAVGSPGKGYAPGMEFELVRDALAADGEETDDLLYAD